MLGIGRLFSKSREKGDGATYGIDYRLGLSYLQGNSRSYLHEKSFDIGYMDFLQLFRDYSKMKTSFRSIREVELLVEPVSDSFDPHVLRRKLDKAVGMIRGEMESNRVILSLFDENPIMYDSPDRIGIMQQNHLYNESIKGAGLIYNWLEKHDRSSSSLKA